MNIDDGIEEMLFGSSSLQLHLDDDWNYITSDDILNDLFDDDTGMLTIPLEEEPIEQDTKTSELLDISSSHSEPGLTVPDRDWVTARIEKMFEDILNSLVDGTGELSIELKTRSNISRRQTGRFEGHNTIPPPRTQTITFPGNSGQEAWRFTVVVRILELIHGCLLDNTIMTKRDIYYRYPDLFVKQSVVDRYVDDLACTLGISRSLLNVTAAAKGLIAGNIVIRRGDGSSVHGLSEVEGILVPKIHDNDTLDLSSVQWILVIEKEATFRSLLSSSQWSGLGTNGVVLTAKGYPDLASRKFLRQMADRCPGIPVLALVDFDPDGIAIMSTYKHGSYRLAHEDVTHKDTPGLKLPDLQWLGVQSHNISRAPVDEGDTETAALTNVQGLMRLTPRDRGKACRMLEWDVCTENGPEPAWRIELQRMLMLNIKVEMQILEELPGGLAGWLGNKLSEMQGSRSAVVVSSYSDEEILF